MPPTNWGTSNNRVLLVDDDELYLETMMAELEDRGFAVRGFPDGPSLFKQLDRASEADALLLDWSLPDMSGIDVLLGVRDRGIDVPVAFLTGRALVDYEHIALNRGAVDFIDKLRGADIIAQRLNRMVVGSRRRPAVAAAERETPLVCGPLTLWHRNPRIEWRGADAGLTLTEYKVISLLVANPGKPQTAGTPESMWFDYLGIQSSGHGPQEPIAITYVDKNFPITKGLADWTTIKEELYNNIQIFPTATPLAKGKQVVKSKKKGPDGAETVEEKTVETVVAWVNTFGKTRVFSTTIGHNNATVEDAKYLDRVARGILWATDKLDADGKAKAGWAK